MSNRIEKVNSLLQKEISRIVFIDFNFSGVMVTVTRVESSSNLILAKAYISVMPEGNAEHIIETLNRGVYSIQKQINKTLKMRPVPKIKFVRDKKVAEASRVEALLEELKKGEK